MNARTPDAATVPRGRWLAWLLGAALLAAVILTGLFFSEARDLAAILQRANPWWLVPALLLQGLTYLAQAQVFRCAPRASGHMLDRGWLYQLSIVKLFVDQSLPSAGLSGTAVVAQALEQQQQVPRGVVAASAILNIVSYQAAYVLLLAVALVITTSRGATTAPIVVISLLFGGFSVGLLWVVLAVSGRKGAEAVLARVRILGGLLRFLQDADKPLTRTPRLLAETTAWQTAIVLLDAATMWLLVRSLGTSAPFGIVFASFMISSVFRSVGVLPGGLGTFEASSVLTLQMMGVSVPMALSATLIFRGLSFWLPMLPGFWFSRRLLAPDGSLTFDAGTYWADSQDAVAHRLGCSLRGLTAEEAEARLRRLGPNTLRPQQVLSGLRVLVNQLRSPLLLLLIFAAATSGFTGEWFDAAIVLSIVGVTVAIGYSREYNAQAAVEALRARVRMRSRVVRGGQAVLVDASDLVPGDVVLLSAGSLVPGDALVLEARDFFVSEAVLTGESYPVEKTPGVVPAHTPLAGRTNCVFLGTNVRSGTARCLVVATGAATAFGTIAGRLTLRPPEAEFDRGIRRFGYLLTIAMLVLVLLVFLAHVVRGRPAVDTLLFAIALAVGLSPELLPAILSVNLARGARMLAQRGVLVRRLNAIENLGSMDVLCTDKTGTLTEGVISLEGAYDEMGAPSSTVLDLAVCNAALETGLDNPLDDAILHGRQPALDASVKLAEIPFDFVRKRVTVAVRDGAGVRLITKGAFRHVLEACATTSTGHALDDEQIRQLGARYEEWSTRGVRVLAVATRTIAEQPDYSRDDERDMTFAGFLTFLDRPKPGISEAIGELSRLGVSVKLITGDNGLVARHVASLVGLPSERVLTGQDIDELHDEALWHDAERTDLFVEVDPNQKERIILALKKMGHVVGFLGDGVNDAPAMHAADTSLSVDQAVDVAREAADFVLLERGLDVIRRGVEEGRRTFANTLKYILITTSANLGNMVSMAAASLMLPFLPLLASQILLNNFLSDIPAVGLADDDVDPELVERPRRWDLRFIGRFMVVFGLVSSAFDFLTFGALRTVFQALPETFRTAWFVESLLTELVVALVMRTRRPFYQSRPGRVLLLSTVALTAVTFAIPFLPFASFVGFVPLSPTLVAAIVIIVFAYVAATELAKRAFYRGRE